MATIIVFDGSEDFGFPSEEFSKLGDVSSLTGIFFVTNNNLNIPQDFNGRAIYISTSEFPPTEQVWSRRHEEIRLQFEFIHHQEPSELIAGYLEALFSALAFVPVKQQQTNIKVSFTMIGEICEAQVHMLKNNVLPTPSTEMPLPSLAHESALLQPPSSAEETFTTNDVDVPGFNRDQTVSEQFPLGIDVEPPTSPSPSPSLSRPRNQWRRPKLGKIVKVGPVPTLSGRTAVRGKENHPPRKVPLFSKNKGKMKRVEFEHFMHFASNPIVLLSNVIDAVIEFLRH